jgi:hypothetical protein
LQDWETTTSFIKTNLHRLPLLRDLVARLRMVVFSFFEEGRP